MRHSSPQQVVQPGRVRAFFEGDMQRPAQSMQKIQNGAGLRGDHRLHHQLALGVQHRHRNRVAVDIQTNILDAIHGVFLSCGFVTAKHSNHNLPRKGRPFIMRGPSRLRLAGWGVFVCVPTSVHKHKTHPGRTSEWTTHVIRTLWLPLFFPFPALPISLALPQAAAIHLQQGTEFVALSRTYRAARERSLKTRALAKPARPLSVKPEPASTKNPRNGTRHNSRGQA